jgi:hypothetical protein
MHMAAHAVSNNSHRANRSPHQACVIMRRGADR